MWSEQVAGEAIEGKLWPRGSALGERLWTDPATGIVSHCWKITPKMSYLNCHFPKKKISLVCIAGFLSMYWNLPFESKQFYKI